jgi:hypothetical protein
MDYDLLMAQPQRLGLFKADLAQWLKELVGDTKYIHDTGKDVRQQPHFLCHHAADWVLGYSFISSKVA